MSDGGDFSVCKIDVTGLKELRKNLKKLDDGGAMVKELKSVLKQASLIVVNQARPEVPLGPPEGGHARSSVKAGATATGARVTGGGAKYPYYPWLDFGGMGGRGKKNKREFLKRGRFIWKAVWDKKQEIHDTLQEGIERVVRESGLGG